MKSGKLIFHIYSRYYFSFEQCNYTLSPTTLVFVESTIYNCNFCLRRNPVDLLYIKVPTLHENVEIKATYFYKDCIEF